MKPQDTMGPASELARMDLATAFAAIQQLLLDDPDLPDFLHELCVVAAAAVPGAPGGIVLDGRPGGGLGGQ